MQPVMIKKHSKVIHEVADELVDASGDTVQAPKAAYPIRLLTLENVRAEMARVYRDARAGRIKTEDGSKLAWTLVQLKTVVEAIANVEQAERILEIETRLGLAKALGAGDVVRKLAAVAPPSGEKLA